MKKITLNIRDLNDAIQIINILEEAGLITGHSFNGDLYDLYFHAEDDIPQSIYPFIDIPIKYLTEKKIIQFIEQKPELKQRYVDFIKRDLM